MAEFQKQHVVAVTRKEIINRKRIGAHSRQAISGPNRLFRLRNMAVILASCAFVFSTALYLVAPSKVAWAMNVSSRHQGSDGSEIMYGAAVGQDGHGIPGVKILISATRGHSGDPVAILTSGPTGAYRDSVFLPSGSYQVSIGSGNHGQYGYVGLFSRTFFVVPGFAYHISLRIVRFGLFFFLPISSY